MSDLINRFGKTPPTRSSDVRMAKVVNLFVAPLFGLFFMALFVRFAMSFGTFVGAAAGVSVAAATGQAVADELPVGHAHQLIGSSWSGWRSACCRSATGTRCGALRDRQHHRRLMWSTPAPR